MVSSNRTSRAPEEPVRIVTNSITIVLKENHEIYITLQKKMTHIFWVGEMKFINHNSSRDIVRRLGESRRFFQSPAFFCLKLLIQAASP